MLSLLSYVLSMNIDEVHFCALSNDVLLFQFHGASWHVFTTKNLIHILPLYKMRTTSFTEF